MQSTTINKGILIAYKTRSWTLIHKNQLTSFSYKPVSIMCENNKLNKVMKSAI